MQAQITLGLFVACIIAPLATAIGPSGPTQPGAPSDCIQWYSANMGDTASGIAESYNIKLDTFLVANPQLSGDPLALWQCYQYCVPQGSKTPPPPGTGGSEPAPTAENPSHAQETGLALDGSGVTSEDAAITSESTVIVPFPTTVASGFTGGETKSLAKSETQSETQDVAEGDTGGFAPNFGLRVGGNRRDKSQGLVKDGVAEVKYWTVVNVVNHDAGGKETTTVITAPVIAPTGLRLRGHPKKNTHAYRQ